MKLVKENLFWFVPGFILWLVCLLFFPKVWAIVTLSLGVGQLISCNKASALATKLFLQRTNK